MVMTQPAALRGSPARHALLHHLQTSGPSTIDVLVEVVGLHPNTVREHLSRLISAGYVLSEPERRERRGRPRMIYRATQPADIMGEVGAHDQLERSIAQAAMVSALVRSFDDSDHSARARDAGRIAAGDLLEQEAAGLGGNSGAGAPEGVARELLALETHLTRYGFDPQLDGGVGADAVPRAGVDVQRRSACVPDVGAAGGEDAAAREGTGTGAAPGEGEGAGAGEGETVTYSLWACPFLEQARERPDVVCSVHAGLAQGVLDQAGGGYEVADLVPFAGEGHCCLMVRRRPGAGAEA